MRNGYVGSDQWQALSEAAIAEKNKQNQILANFHAAWRHCRDACAEGLRCTLNRARLASALPLIAACAVLGACAATSTPSAKPDEAYAKAAWAYFKNKCVTEAGEKIYKTFTGVKSVLIVKPLPPATDKDHFDQFWYGDPYSLPATSNRVVRAAGLLTLGSRKDSHIYRGLQFVEFRDDTGGKLQYRKVSSPQDHNDFYVENIEKPISTYGVSWDDISTPEDRKYWIAGSRLRVIDLASNSTIAERIGYFIEAGFGSNAGGRRPWLTSRGPQTTCPPLHGDYTDQQFVSKLFGLREEK